MRLLEIGAAAKEASYAAARLSQVQKNNVLKQCAKKMVEHQDEILEQNKKDIEDALAAGIKGAFIDRLTLTEARIKAMADGLLEVAALNDPVGEIIRMNTLPNGLIVGQKRVPIGVIGIIYESRPNVTSDAFALCLKAGSAVILKGGKESLRSNMAIVSILQDVFVKSGLPKEMVQLIESTQRETTVEFMKMNRYVDVLIPRGSGGLIKSVLENSTIPVIETGVGNCHIFCDETAHVEKAIRIIINAKVQRPGVCNAAEKLLIHENIADSFIPVICKELADKGVEIRGDERVCALFPAKAATEADWPLEYEDYIIAIKVVKDVDQAIAHIREYSSNHSEAIITENYSNAQKFLEEVDSAAVYVNASTRFTDGNQMGLGAEIGISTQKLHARGPMGLRELTTTKYIIYGQGQIRE